MSTKINPNDAIELIETHLRSSEHSWSIGIPGAIAEFMYDAEAEKIQINSGPNWIEAKTPRGTLSIRLPEELHCIAYEEFSPCIKSWSQQLVFCLPKADARQKARHALAKLSKDEIGKGTEDTWFDLGLGSEYLRFAIRTGDEELLNTLNENLGRSIFDERNPVMGVILEKSPVRVISSAIGSIEIYGKIPDPGEMSPSGPHTHLLPKFLNSEKLLVPLPDELTPLLTLYPVHPLFDKYGKTKPFDSTAHEHFQSLLGEYGLPEYCSQKSFLNGKPESEEIKEPGEIGLSHWQKTAQKVIRIQRRYLN